MGRGNQLKENTSDQYQNGDGKNRYYPSEDYVAGILSVHKATGADTRSAPTPNILPLCQAGGHKVRPYA